MFTVTDIDRLILHEKKGKQWDWVGLCVVLSISILLLVLGHLHQQLGDDLGYKLGNICVSLLAPASMVKIRQHGNTVNALEILRDKLKSAAPGSAEAEKIEDVLIVKVRKMLEG